MNEKDYLDFIEEGLVESFIALIFVLAFILGGIITSYFIETTMIKDIVIATSGGIGLIALLLKIYKQGLN